MKVKPFQFCGSCANCGCMSTDDPMAAVALISEDDADDEFDSTEWLCLKCATKLARRLRAAVKSCRAKVKRGLEYRHEKWQKKAKPKAAKPAAKETP